MSSSDPSCPIGKTVPLPLVRMTLACQNKDEFLRDFYDRYRSDGIFVPTERVRPVGERIRLRIEFLDCSVDYSSEAFIIAHEQNGSAFGMRLLLDPPEPAATPGRPLRAMTALGEDPPDSEEAPPPIVSLAEYLCEPTATPVDTTARSDERTTDALDESAIPIVEPSETEPRADWPSFVCQIFLLHSVEAVEGLYRTLVKARDLEPTTALAAAEAMVDLARSDRSGRMVHFVRRLTRNGHEILELALERLECALTPEHRCKAQQLFDEALQVVVVP
jgi:hypothetical protein